MSNAIKNALATMTSTRLAVMLDMDKKEVHRELKAMFQDETDGGKFPRSLDSRGYVIQYYLPKIESIMYAATKNRKILRMVTEYWVGENATGANVPQLEGEVAALKKELADRPVKTVSMILKVNRQAIRDAQEKLYIEGYCDKRVARAARYFYPVNEYGRDCGYRNVTDSNPKTIDLNSGEY